MLPQLLFFEQFISIKWININSTFDIVDVEMKLIGLLNTQRKIINPILPKAFKSN